MLGTDSERRFRLFVLSDGDYDSVVERVPNAGRRPTVSHCVIDYSDQPRSATTIETDGAFRGPGGEIPVVPVQGPALDRLAAEIEAAVDDYETAARGLDPAQLRVAVDTLGPLFDQHDPDAVADWLDSVHRLVVEHDGMAHFLLAEPYSSERVTRLEPEFDAVVEVRTHNDPGHVGKERWHVPELDVTTGWALLGGKGGE